jgi:hypothetical protein
MFGIRFIKVQPTTYLLQYRNGQIAREGAGLSFFYFSPNSSLVAVPVASTDAPFIFEETTADYQAITLQGQVTYRVADPKRLAALLNFTLDPSGRGFVSDDPDKLPQRVINNVKVLGRAELQKLALKDALRAADTLVGTVRSGIAESPEMKSLGLEVIGLSILAIKPVPETSSALEAETRERLMREADEATYARRNAAVEQERAIKENELSTEIAVENKKRQIREAQMDAEKMVQERKHALRQADMLNDITLEEKRKNLVTLNADNTRAEADARAYGLSATVRAFGEVDAKVLQALANAGMKPEQLIASAFTEIASRADKIGQLNISPDLLRELMANRGE